MPKTLIAAAAAALTLGTAATAQGFLEVGDTYEPASVIELGTVNAPAGGVVEIYDFHRGEIGALLGTEMVAAGADFDVRVNVGSRPVHDVIAVLTVDGQVVDTRELEIR